MRDVGSDPKDKVIEAAMGLSVEDRAEVVARLIETIGPPDERTDAEWTTEIVRRAKEVEDGTAELVDWGDARKRIEEKLRKL